MDLENEVREAMRQSANALTVDQVTPKVAENIKDEIRSILNALVKNEDLQSVRGGGGYQTCYKAHHLSRSSVGPFNIPLKPCCVWPRQHFAQLSLGLRRFSAWGFPLGHNQQ